MTTKIAILSAALGLLAAPAAAQTLQQDLASLAAKADRKIVDDASLDGRAGTAQPDPRSPILVQSAVYSRAIEVVEATSLKWTVFDTEKIKPGQILYGVEGAWCTHWLVCLADEDNNGTLETGYVQTDHIASVIIFTHKQHKLDPPKIAATFRPAPVPEAYRHEIAVMVDNISGKDGALKALVQVKVRRAPAGQWIVIGGLGHTVNFDAEGKAVFEALGARIDLQAKDRKSFAYTIVRSFPEQPLEGFLRM